MTEKIEERLRKIADYHIPEWADRLEEIGGIGVGGSELSYAPHFVQSAVNKNEFIAMALERSIYHTWEEVAWCYVFGEFRACIVMSAALLEIALKYELYRRGIKRSGTLGTIIQKCKKERIISESIFSLAESVKQRRNDIMHANIQIDRPESLLNHTSNEHEILPIRNISRNFTYNGCLKGDGETIEVSFIRGQSDYSKVFMFKRAARASLFDVKEILKFLYSSIPNQ